MITHIEKIIRENLSQRLFRPDAKLYFMKFSTPTSGLKQNDKVIFFVFQDESAQPFLCVKTVRQYSAKKAILNNFNNLKELNRLCSDSIFKEMFAEALYLHDDGEEIFSIESACIGDKIDPTEENIKLVLERYADFQKYSAGKSEIFIKNIAEYGSDILRKSGLPDGEIIILNDYLKNLPMDWDARIPELVQHGDLTMDNMLVSKKDRLHIVDYDYVGISHLPGFDFFHLISRYHKKDLRVYCARYLPDYFKSVGIDASNFDALIFLYYVSELIFKKPHLLQSASAKLILENFEKMYS